jgi:dTDP-4-amino-4,6-dideoxygalactose transaminase
MIKRFGHTDYEHFTLGINGKQDECNAAMGLCNLGHMKRILAERKNLSALYDSMLNGKLGRPEQQKELDYNYSYYPVLFRDEKSLLSAFERLAAIGVYPRRYFYPSLNRLPYIKPYFLCPIAEDIALRIACLPLFVGLNATVVEKICRVLLKVI